MEETEEKHEPLTLSVTGTAEQQFLLMMMERLDAAEAMITRLKHCCGIDKPPPKIHTSIQDLYDRLIENDHATKTTKCDTKMTHMTRVVPEDVLARVNTRNLQSFANLIDDTYRCLKKINCKCFIEACQEDMHEDVAAWLIAYMQQYMHEE